MGFAFQREGGLSCCIVAAVGLITVACRDSGSNDGGDSSSSAVTSAGGETSGSTTSSNGNTTQATTAGMTSSSGGSSTTGSSSAARGAVSLSILSPDGCSLTEQFQDFPSVPSGHAVTATEKLMSVEDGTTTADGAPVEVICDWLGFEPPFTFRGRITVGEFENERMVEVGSRMELGVPANGGVVVIDPELPSQYGSSSA